MRNRCAYGKTEPTDSLDALTDDDTVTGAGSLALHVVNNGCKAVHDNLRCYSPFEPRKLVVFVVYRSRTFCRKTTLPIHDRLPATIRLFFLDIRFRIKELVMARITLGHHR